MISEPQDAPVSNAAKPKYYLALVAAIVFGGILIFFVLPNLWYLTAEGPAVSDEFEVALPSGDGLDRLAPFE